MKRIILSATFCGALLMACAQNFQEKFYTERDGLSDNHIAQLLRDRTGFLWVATAFGLNRFDGNAFEKFLYDPADSNSIADNNIQQILLDRENRLWVGTNAGLSLYHPESGNFSNYSPDSTVLPQAGVSFKALQEDSQGNIWVGTKNDLLVFDPRSHRFTSSGWAAFAAGAVPAGSNHLRVVVLSIRPRNADECWVLTTYGLFSVQTSSRSFRYYPNAALLDYFGCVLDYIDPGGNPWIGTYDKGIFYLDSRSNTWTNYHTPPELSMQDNAFGMMAYGTDTLVYGSGSALFFFDTRRRIILSKVPLDPASAIGNPEYVCNSIAPIGQRLWAGTNSGLVRLTPASRQFHFNSLPGEEMVGRVFHSAQHGVLVYSKLKPAENLYDTYISVPSSPPVLVRTPDGKPLHSSYQYIAESGDGHLYLNDEQFVYYYDFDRQLAIPLPLPPKTHPAMDYDTRNMVTDRQGRLWIRSFSQGIFRYDPASNTCRLASEIPLSGKKEINALYYDSLSNTIWVGEEFNGVFVYDLGSGQVRHFGLPKPRTQRSAAITCITGDGRGRVWLADLQSGMLQYDAATGQFRRFTIYDGMLSNNCSWITTDAQGLLWIISESGLTKYNPRGQVFTNYTQKEGYPFSPNAYISADRNGNLLMPYRSGYYSWNSAQVQDPRPTGHLYVRDLMLLNAHLAADSNYSFSYKENSLRLLPGLLSFDSRDHLGLEYSLNGNSWISADINAYISFANLAPGRYDLQLRVKNEPIPVKHIRFIIREPFWQRWWFVVLAFALAGIVLLLVGRNRLRAVRQESGLRQQLMESEMTALRSQMNPHFIFNTLNSINSYIIENKRDEASDYLTDFSRLMRVILEHSGKKTVSLADELGALRLYLELESRRLEASFDYQILVSPLVDPALVSLPPLIIQPFVENAIWHGLRGKKGPGQIRIGVEPYPEGLLIVVSDDGIGREAAGKLLKVRNGKSFGLEATLQRIRLNDPRSRVLIEDLYDPEGQSAGTRVSIYVYQHEQYYGLSQD